MKLDPQPAQPVRIVTTHEGKFLSMPDMIARLNNERVLDQALTLMTVGNDRKDNPRQIMQRVIAEFIASCSGDMPKAKSDFRGRGKT